MAGIYIHIPFCKKACTYCNFHFSTSLNLQNDFLEALLKEIGLRQDYLQGAVVESVYFGGGTPSLLPSGVIRQVLESLADHYKISEEAEVTLEANPDDIQPASVDAWATAGINRLSIGIQSFFEEDLKWMNRAHNAEQARKCLDIAGKRFEDLTLDLIYGTPLMTDEKWNSNLQTAFRSGIPHLSCYALTTEEGTLLHHQIKKGHMAAPAQEDQARQFDWLVQATESEGFEHYEISNFAKPGYRSRHNSSYWTGEHYLGLGPSAHSYNGVTRQWNASNNAIYIRQLNKSILPAEKEELGPAQKANEYIMLALRRMEGIDTEMLHEKLNENGRRLFEKKVIEYEKKTLIDRSGKSIKLTRSGKLFADGIASDLFVEEKDCVPYQTSVSSMNRNPLEG